MATPTKTLATARFEEADEVQQVPRGRIELIDIAGNRVARITYEPGWRWQSDMRPVVGGENCQLRHLGATLSGHLHVRTKEGEEVDLTPGGVFVLQPGHEGWVVGDEPWVSIDFEAYRK